MSATIKFYFALISLLILVSCSQEVVVENSEFIEVNESEPIADWPILDTSKRQIEHGYYQFMLEPDSTIRIAWGNESFRNISQETFEWDWFFWKVQDAFLMSTKDYFVMRYGTGSDTWIDIVFLWKANANEQYFNEVLAYDYENPIMVCAGHGEVTVMHICNFLTKNEQVVLRNHPECESAMMWHCIDSISFSNGFLFYRWNESANKKDKSTLVDRRVKLKV